MEAATSTEPARCGSATAEAAAAIEAPRRCAVEDRCVVHRHAAMEAAVNKPATYRNAAAEARPATDSYAEAVAIRRTPSPSTEPRAGAEKKSAHEVPRRPVSIRCAR